MLHLQLTIEYLFENFNTIIAIITGKYSCRIRNSETIVTLVKVDARQH